MKDPACERDLLVQFLTSRIDEIELALSNPANPPGRIKMKELIGRREAYRDVLNWLNDGK